MADSDNLKIYNTLRTPPPEALKTIGAGRLKGKSDINPMWRIKALTELFGPCGTGWRVELVRTWLESGANGEQSAFVEINLYYKINDDWSSPVPGIGGAAYVANEKNGKYTSDECFKMAYTDAISVSCKMLGVAGDVYWDKDPTKYAGHEENEAAPTAENNKPVCKKCGQEIKAVKNSSGKILPPSAIESRTGGLCMTCFRVAAE